MVPDDRPFVASSWRVSYRESVHNPGLARWLRKSAYGRAHDALIEATLDHGQVAICHDPEDATHILGWICFDPPSWHYVYVKEAFRRRGIASVLLTIAQDYGLPQACEITHRTAVGDEFLASFGKATTPTEQRP